MASTRNSIVFLNVIVLIASVILTAFLVVDMASAEPKKTTSSMASRVQAQREQCEDAGGGQMDYVNSYEDGKLVGVTTYCKGGTSAGWNCANTATTYECWQGPKSRQVPDRLEVTDVTNVQVLPGIGSMDAHADAEVDMDIVQATPAGGLPDGGIEDPEIGSSGGDNNNTTFNGPPADAVDPTAGEPSIGPVIAGPSVKHPNTDVNQNPIVILEVTSTPAS